MAKKESLNKWFSRNNGKGWIDCKTGKPCGRKSAKGGKDVSHRKDGSTFMESRSKNRARNGHGKRARRK